jgi:hypothetical protein
VPVLALAASCGSVADWLTFRALDLADCGKINTGYGLGIAIDGRLTDWLAPGLGYISYTTNFGWDDRIVAGIWEECIVINTPKAVFEAVLGSSDDHAAPDYDSTWSVGRLALASVFLSHERWIRHPKRPEVTVDLYSLFNFGPVSDYLREADPQRYFLREGETVVWRRKPFFDQGWIELGVTAVFLHARAGVNVFQSVDFVLGLVGLDPAGDDRRKLPRLPQD